MKNAVFLWVPKTAGTSIHQVLSEKGMEMFLNLRDIRIGFKQEGMVTFGHLHYETILERGLVSEEFDRHAFKFAFVRNPYDRFLSLFRYIQSKMGERVCGKDVNQFAKIVESRGFSWPGAYNVDGFSQVCPQYKWLLSFTGRWIPDFVGRYERVNSDFGKICDALGIRRRGLPFTNESQKDKKPERFDDNTIRFIQKTYKMDFELFGYEKEV